MVAARIVLQASMVASRFSGLVVMVPWMTIMPTVVSPSVGVRRHDARREAGVPARATMANMGDESTDAAVGTTTSTTGTSSPAGAGSTGARPAYPPDKHFLRDLDTATWQVTADRLLMTAPLTDGYRNEGGTAALGFLAAL